MRSLSATSKENHLPVLCRASPSFLVPAAWRSKAASSCSGLMQTCKGTVTRLTCGQSPAGIPLATFLWPYARGILFLFWFSFLPRRDFFVHKGFSKESQLLAGSPASVQRLAREKREIRKQGNNLVREKNMKCGNKCQVSQRTHGNCFTPSEQHLLMQTALLISMRSLL